MRRTDNSAPALIPVIVANKTTLGRGTLAVRQAGHTEFDGLGRIERCGVEHGDTVPARLYCMVSSHTSERNRGRARYQLTLNRQVLLETLIGLGVMEYLLERRILESSTVDVSSDPVIVEDGGTLDISLRFDILQNTSFVPIVKSVLTMSSWYM